MADIIVIDDEKIIRLLLREILKQDGHTVRVTRDGCEAIEIIREKQPDLIITDIFMPEKSGLEVIMEIRRNYPDIEIIAISGDSASRAGGHRDCLGLASSLGCSGILEKPFTNEQVLREVQKALSGQSSEES